MPEGPTHEPALEAALRAARRSLSSAQTGDRKPGGTAGAVQAALEELVHAVENDDRVFPRMRPVR